MKRTLVIGTLALLAFAIGCDDSAPNSDQVQQNQQETILKEATAETGMPAIKNFRERKLLKDILELRDQDGLVTYTYLFPENSGEPKFFCTSVGYGIPYATEYTSPQKIDDTYVHQNFYRQSMPQADPNGLFAPADAEGTWVMCKDPNGTDVRPVYLEPRVIVTPFKLP